MKYYLHEEYFHLKIKIFWPVIRIQMYPNWFGSLDPDPHGDKKLDPDPHVKLMRIRNTGPN